MKPDYSYNWPYDHCSLIEMARVSGGVSIMPPDWSTATERAEDASDRADQRAAEIAAANAAAEASSNELEIRETIPVNVEVSLSPDPFRLVTGRVTTRAITVGNSSLVSRTNYRSPSLRASPIVNNSVVPTARPMTFGNFRGITGGGNIGGGY
jgi:hypothetical protein